MSIVVIGVNHRTGPLSLLERLAIRPDEQRKAISGLVSRHNIREAVVLSTCNRTEIYAVAERFHGAYSDIRDFLCDLGGLDADELQSHLYSQHDDAAVTHLFEVAAGLDSAVLGESERLDGGLPDGVVALPDGRSNERSSGTVLIASGRISSLLA